MEKRYKYLLVFFVTFWVFAAAWYLSSFTNQEKLIHVQNTQDKVAIGILSSENQLDLLEDAPCENIKNLNFSKELISLADKINYSEQNLNNPIEALNLKKQYSILEVKDFILTKRIASKCKLPNISILYFYGTKINCPNCIKQSYVLDVIRQKYPEIRIYAFDSSLDLATIHAMKTIYNINEELPAIVLNGKTFSGFQSLDQILEKLNFNKS